MKTKRDEERELEVETLSVEETLEHVLNRAGVQRRSPASQSDRIRVEKLARMRDERRPRKLSEG